MADAIFASILLYSVVFGARRGFFKEVIHVVALVAAVSIARRLREPVGDRLAPLVGGSHAVGEVAAVVIVWILAFLAIAIVGRLILKKLRGDTVGDKLDEGAEGVADAIGGDTKKGPVTLLTDPIARAQSGLVYWSDKLLGALLGLVKGVITGYVVLALAIYASRWGWESSFAQSAESSYAIRLYDRVFRGQLESLPEYRIAASLGEMHTIARAVREDPRRFQAFLDHAQIAPLRSDPRITSLGTDPDVLRAWEARDLRALLGNPRVRELIADRELRGRIAAVDWSRVRQDVEASSRPQGTGGG